VKQEKIGFIGLGFMGFPMCKFLCEDGFDVTVWARKPEAAQEAVEICGCKSAPTVKELAKNITVASVVLYDDASVIKVLEEDGLIDNMAPGSIIMVHATISLGLTRRLIEVCNKRGITYVDAPISGKGGDKGNCTMMAGCSEEIWDRICPILKSEGGYAVRVGEATCGIIAKLCNNVALIVEEFGAGYALKMGEKAGCDPDKLLEVMTQPGTTSNCWFLQNYVYLCPGMELFDKGEGQFKNLPKDLQLALELAKEVGQEFPVAEACIGLNWKDIVCDKYKGLEQTAGLQIDSKKK